MINHCESDPSKTQSSLELRDGRSEREAAERMEKERESAATVKGRRGTREEEGI